MESECLIKIPLTRANQNGTVCNSIKYKSKIVHRKYKQILPYLFLREHNLLQG